MKNCILLFVISTIFLATFMILFALGRMDLAIYIYMPIAFLIALPTFILSFLGLVLCIYKYIKYSNDIKIYQVILAILLMIISIWFIYTLFIAPLDSNFYEWIKTFFFQK